MWHYALLDNNNVVTDIITGQHPDVVVEGVDNWESYYGEFHGCKAVGSDCDMFGGQHSEGSIPFRKNHASIGGVYDEIRDAFIPPHPYPSWVLDEDTCLWDAPVPKPNDGQPYSWDEDTVSWVQIDAGD